MSQQISFSDSPIGQSLAWLADAPLFIDGPQVTALYNAVVKPEYETETIKVSLKSLKTAELTGEGSVEVEVGVASWLKTIFPFLDASAKAAGKLAATGGFEKEEANEVELHPIDTPQRQLVQLALHYFANLPQRSLVVSKLSDENWVGPTFIEALPRGLVFVDFPSSTRFVPMAIELSDGQVTPIYPSLIKTFVGPKIAAPQYPEPAYYTDKCEELVKARKEYWEFFEKYFSSTLSMQAVEAASKGGLLRWIDYRIPLGSGLPYLHLHVQGRGQYDTGTFAYSLIKRGFKHGLRVVGTMKSEPAMNALAIFEK
jgi:hypothetical protein